MTQLPTKLEPSVDAFAEHVHFLERRHGYFDTKISFPLAVTIIAQIQLALRHPGNNGDSARRARNAIDAWIDVMETASPGIGALLRLGDNPAHDVPTRSKDGAIELMRGAILSKFAETRHIHRMDSEQARLVAEELIHSLINAQADACLQSL